MLVDELINILKKYKKQRKRKKFKFTEITQLFMRKYGILFIIKCKGRPLWEKIILIEKRYSSLEGG